jgi:hypothetical protein
MLLKGNRAGSYGYRGAKNLTAKAREATGCHEEVTGKGKIPTGQFKRLQEE